MSIFHYSVLKLSSVTQGWWGKEFGPKTLLVLCIEMLVGNELQRWGWLLASVCVAFPFFTRWGTPVALRRA